MIHRVFVWFLLKRIQVIHCQSSFLWKTAKGIDLSIALGHTSRSTTQSIQENQQAVGEEDIILILKFTFINDNYLMNYPLLPLNNAYHDFYRLSSWRQISFLFHSSSFSLSLSLLSYFALLILSFHNQHMGVFVFVSLYISVLCIDAIDDDDDL